MRKFCSIALLSLFLAICQMPIFAFAGKTDYALMIDKIAEKYVGKSVPGACVLVSEGGELVFSSAYGYADREKKIPMNTEAMVFEWGSISKTFTWVSVFQLAEQGKIDLHEDIRNYLPEGFLQNLHYDESITMLHLMNHTAGFEDQLIDLRYFSENQESSLREVLSAHQPQQIFAPGEISAYSNWGAALAALIVEQVSGQEYRAYVYEHILLPLGMSSTSPGPFWHDVPGLLSQKSKGYSFTGKSFTEEDAMHLRMYPAGGTNGSVGDLLRYAQELAKSSEKDSILFKNVHTKENMFTESHRSYGANAGLSHGFWQYVGNPEILGHEGGTYGFKSQFWVEPKRERAILIICNVMETEFCSEIMEALAYRDMVDTRYKNIGYDDYPLPEGDYLPARSVRKNVGRIQGKIQMISIRAAKEGGLYLTMPFKGKNMYYERLGNNIFFCKEAAPEEKILAFRIKNGTVHSMTFRLAHDYVPAKNSEGKAATLLAFTFYIAGGLFFCVCLNIHIFSFLRGRKPKRCCSMPLAFSGSILGISGIAGMLHWFSVYTIISDELTALVSIGQVCVATGLLYGGYACIKKRSLGQALPLLLFSIQSLAACHLGFLTRI